MLREAEICLLDYLGDNRYFASFPRRAVDRILALAVARVPGFRSSELPRLALPVVPAWARDPQTGRPRVSVAFFADVSVEDAEAALQGMQFRREAGSVWLVEEELDRLEALLGLDLVERISIPGLPFMPLNAEGRRLSRSEVAQAPRLDRPRPIFRVDGTGVGVGVFDNGINQEHDDFDEVGADGGPTGVSRVVPHRHESNLHGTLVASIAAGSGVNSEKEESYKKFELRGHAPYARIGEFEPLGPDAGGLAARFACALVGAHMDVTNHSYAQSLAIYDERASLLDRIIRGDEPGVPSRPQVWAVGNNAIDAQYPCGGWDFPCLDGDGYYSTFVSAKNSIAVGSFDTEGARLSSYSSLGPTLDGRIKPDIVAPGCRKAESRSIRGANANTPGYWQACGTSMAAPAVAGVIALLIDECGQAAGCTRPQLASTYRAVLIQTAIDQRNDDTSLADEPANPDTQLPTKFGVGPDFATGWGLVDAEEARQLMGTAALWKERSVDSALVADEWCVGVVEGSEYVRVTIAWDDLPGKVCSQRIPACSEEEPRLKNDLDLTLVGSGQTHLPWLLLPPQSEGPRLTSGVKPPSDATRGPDHLNNVERVDVSVPAAGWWVARVLPYRLPEGGKQSYSIASSHELRRPPCPVSDPEPLQVVERASREPLLDQLWFGVRNFLGLDSAPDPRPEDLSLIVLSNREIHPLGRVEADLSEMLAAGKAPSEAIVQLNETPSVDVVRGLASHGVHIRTYIGAGAYFARIESENSLASDPRIRWAGLALPEDKISNAVWQGGLAAVPGTTHRVIVYFDEATTREDQEAILQRFASRVYPHRILGGRLVEVPTASLGPLGADVSVRWVEEPPKRFLPLGSNGASIRSTD